MRPDRCIPHTCDTSPIKKQAACIHQSLIPKVPTSLMQPIPQSHTPPIPVSRQPMICFWS